jgi:hypothetical protein
MLRVNYAECRKLVHYAECHYAECRYAECRYAKDTPFALTTHELLSFLLWALTANSCKPGFDLAKLFWSKFTYYYVA